MGEQLCDCGEEDSSQLQQVSNHVQQSRTLQGQETQNLPQSKDLNEALEREPYYTRSIEEIMASFMV